MLGKAVKMANLTYSVEARSCTRLAIEKVYWKSIALPLILCSSNAIGFNKEETPKIMVGRKWCEILRTPSYAQETTLRGEICISSMKSRIIEGQLKYLQHIL